MGRTLRIVEGGFVYHVLNRGNARRTFLHKTADYNAFLRILAEAREQGPMRILAWCLLPNHWHLILWPTLAARTLTTEAQRHREEMRENFSVSLGLCG